MYPSFPRWCLLLALSATASAEVYPAGSSSIAIYLGVEQRVSQRSLDQMKAEVETLLRPSDIRVDWRQLGTPRAQSEDFTNLYVLQMRGQCSVDRVHLLFSELGPYGDAMALGSAATVDHQVQPFGKLECDRIRSSLAPALRAEPTPKREALFGIVLGRVMAHELFHMITGQSAHADHGLFRSSQKVKELATKSFSFNAEEQLALRRAISAAPVR